MRPGVERHQGARVGDLKFTTGLPLRTLVLIGATDVRNIRAQGYVPLTASTGERIMLVEAPRSFRGGLSFIF